MLKNIQLLRYRTFFRADKIIPLVFSLSLAYLVLSFLYPVVFLRKIKLSTVRAQGPRELKTDFRSAIKPFEFYLQGITGRKIFGSLALPETISQELPESGVNSDVLKDITLLGIISGEDPQAVLEDKLSGKSYSLRKNQFMNEYMIEDIREGKVILNYKGQRFELNL